MNKPSFLLGLNGTKQSQLAAELAFDLACKAEAQLTAQHVVDTTTTWDFLRNEEPGFVGSGLYVETFEMLKKAQFEIATKLIDKYESVAKGKKIDSITVIDEGAPVEEICRRAQDHDLVIVGHQYSTTKHSMKNRWHHVSYAVAEGLANHCPKPLLIVQKAGPSFWQDMQILVSLEHMNISFIRACLRTALFFGVTPKIICLMSGYHEEKADTLIENLRQTHSDLKEIEIHTKVVHKANEVDQTHLELWSQDQAELEFDFEQFQKSLLLVPTREVGEKRISILGIEANELVAQLSIPALLLWPEECIGSHTVEDRDFEKLTA